MPRAISDLKVTASDALEFEAIQSNLPKRRLGLKWVAWWVAFVVLLGGGWLVFGDVLMRLASEDGNDIPLIRAPDGPVKVRPENPGGLQVPNRDKLVYERMQSGASSSSSDSVIERLLPQPEKLLPKPGPGSTAPSIPPAANLDGFSTERAPARPALPMARIPAVNDVVSVQPPPLPPAPLTNAQPQGAPLNLRRNLERPAQPPAAAIPKAPVQSTPKNGAPTDGAPPTVTLIPSASVAAASTSTNVPQAVERTASMRTKIPTPPTGASFLIQLAAFRTPEGAQSEWDRVRREHLNLLGNLKLKVTKVDLGPKKGVFYRLRVGPLANDVSARTLCKELSRRKMGCLVVKPGR